MTKELTQTQAMTFLNVSKPTIIKFRKAGYAKAVRRGGRFFYDVASLQALKGKRVEVETAAARRVAEQLSDARTGLLASEDALEKERLTLEHALARGLRSSQALNRCIAIVVQLLKDSLVQTSAMVGAARKELELGRASIPSEYLKRLEADLAFLDRVLGAKAKAFEEALDFLLACTKEKGPGRQLDWSKFIMLSTSASHAGGA